MRNEIDQRVQGRGFAEEWLEAADLEGKTADYIRGFWCELYDRMPEVAKPTPHVPMLRFMDEEEAKRFERKEIAYGRHQGQQYGDVPITYLTWVADSATELQAYLRSVRGRERTERETDDRYE